MKTKTKKLAAGVCLTALAVLCTALGSAFMREPEASAEGIETYGTAEDVTETIEASSFSEGVTYESEKGVYFEYDSEYGGFVAVGFTDECEEAYTPDKLTISVSGKEYTYPVVRIEDEAFEGNKSNAYNENITYVRVGRYVEYVGVSAFYWCKYVESVEYFAENAVSGAGANASYSTSPFGYVGNAGMSGGLTLDLFIGETVEVVPDGMFSYIFSPSITFAENSRLKKIGDKAFYNMSYIASSYIPEIRIPDTVESVGAGAFSSNYVEVKALYIPENLTEVGKGAFAMSNVDVLYFNAKAFPECDKDLSPFGGLSSKQWNLNGRWESGKSGTTVYIGRNVTRIPEYCFYGSMSASAKAGAYISSVYPDCCASGGSDDGGYALESIGSYAFSGCGKLSEVVLPMGVETIEAYAFDACSSLTSVTLGDTDGWYVTDSDGTKADGSVQYYFGAEFMSDPSTVAKYLRSTYIDYCFNFTDGFSYELSGDGSYFTVSAYTGDGGAVTIPETHRGRPVKEIGAEAFYGDTSVTSLVIPGSVEKICDRAFYGCSKMASVTICEAGLKEVGLNAFYNCTSLKSLYLYDVAAFVSVDFAGRQSNPLSKVSQFDGKVYVGGASVTSLTISGTDRIGTYALAYCTVISDIVIGDSVKTISSYAFYGNTSINSITIPSSVKEIGANAFSGSGVTEVSFAVTGGWKIYDDSGSLFAELTSSELSSGAAGYLTGALAGYTWVNEKTNFLAPVITGVSSDPEGFYTNGDISVYVSVAEGSFCEAVYWKAPGEDAWSRVSGDVLTLPAEDLVCGTYVFMAEDSDGNVSDCYYAVFDDQPPEIYATGATIFDGYVGEGFTVYATDDLSPVTLLWSYRGGDWTRADGDSFVVLSSSGDGRYSFLAEDAAGNRCGEYTLILDTAEPYGSWEKLDHGTYALSFVWEDESWSCEMNGEPYASGSPITTEGSWTATLTTLSGIKGSFSTDLTHNYVVESVSSSNCEEGGTAVYVCTYCGASYEAETEAAAGHTYALEIVEPTCETEGYSVSVCTICGTYDFSTYSYLSPLGHDVLETEISATCEEDGFRGAVCLRCGKEFDGTALPATGHLWYVSTYEAGCESEGYRETVCLRCSEVSSYEVIDPLGHDFVERSRTEATCVEASLVTYRCARCSSVYEAYEGGTAEHDYSVVSVVRDSSCGVEGERRLTCSVCGDFVTEAIPALSHNNVETGRYKDSETGETFVTYACSICGESFTVSIGNQEEAVASGITGMMDTYTRYMWWILLATVAVWSVAMGVRYAVARNSDDKAKAKSMIVNYVIGIVVIAVILVACPYLVYAIALLAG